MSMIQTEYDTDGANNQFSSSEKVKKVMVYKVTLHGVWQDIEKRIWKSKDNKLYKIDENNNASLFIESQLDNDGQLSNTNTNMLPPTFEIVVDTKLSRPKKKQRKHL